MRRSLLPAVGIAAFAAVFFAPELFGGRLAVTGNMNRWLPWAETATEEQRNAPSVSLDCNLSYYPRRAVLHSAWSTGEIPYWNPYAFCGTPFLGDVQSGVLYPPNWPLLPMEPGKQMGWFLFLHAAWAGIGTFVLVRGRGAPESIAFAAGCAWVVNGYFAKHFGQPTFLATVAWMPWVIHLSLRLVRTPGLREAALLGLCGAMTFLAGQPQIAVLAAYAALLVAATAWLTEPRAGARPALGRVAVTLAGAGGLAALLAGAQLLPTRELASLSARAESPYSAVLSGALHPVELIRFLVPDFFGTPLTADQWSTLFPRGDGFYLRNQMNSVFAGTPVFLMALWGMTASRTRRAALPFTLLFLAGALLAFGSPLARMAYEALPGFRFSRIDRAGSLVVLAMIVPAALGAADLSTARGRARRVVGAAVILLALAATVLVLRSGAQLPAWLGAEMSRLPEGGLDPGRVQAVFTRTAHAAAFAAGTGLMFLLSPSWFSSRVPLVLACVQLFLFASPYRMDRAPEDVFPPSRGVDLLRSILDAGPNGGGRFVRFGRDMPLRPYPLSSVLPPSTNVPYALRDLQGYNALADRRLGDALEHALGENVFSHGIWTGRRIVAPEQPASLEHPLLDALSVRAAVSGRPFRAAGWTPEPTAGFLLSRNRDAAPRVRLVPRGRGVPQEEMDRLLRDGDLDDAVWVGEGELPEGSDRRGTAEVIRESWNEISVRVRTPEPAVLVVADSYSPGWTATVDGSAAEILPVYGLVRGVLLPPGERIVRMRYRPPRFALGIALSLAGLALAGTALAVSRDPDPGTL